MDHLTVDELLDYCQRGAPADRVKEIDSHVAECPMCFHVMDSVIQRHVFDADDSPEE